jgi:hypothetical protein
MILCLLQVDVVQNENLTRNVHAMRLDGAVLDCIDIGGSSMEDTRWIVWAWRALSWAWTVRAWGLGIESIDRNDRGMDGMKRTTWAWTVLAWKALALMASSGMEGIRGNGMGMESIGISGLDNEGMRLDSMDMGSIGSCFTGMDAVGHQRLARMAWAWTVWRLMVEGWALTAQT